MKVVGITGTIGSGKTLVRNLLRGQFDCHYVLLSTILRRKLGKSAERKTLQDFGNEIRQKFGPHILAEIAVESLPEKELIIIDGIRNPAEVEFLRKKFGDKFKLIAVDAPLQMRFERAIRRRRDEIKNFREFLELDERDKGKGEPAWGQQVAKCIELADFVVMNDGTKGDLEKKIKEIADSLKGQ